ncbi:MAG: adenylyl-sulfate kinase [Polyangiaceae bacterium]|nr:adenylyl-sulfate kinase [Polyangiaceae bacterium]
MGQAALDELSRDRTVDAGGVVVWLGGPSGAMKSSLAETLRREFIRKGYLCAALDGAVVEHAIVPPHGDAPEGRRAFHETLARLAAMLCDQGQVVIVAATDNDFAYRKAARDIATRFLEVRVDAGDAPNGALNLRLPGFDHEDRLPRPDIVARHGQDGAAIVNIVNMVARWAC